MTSRLSDAFARRAAANQPTFIAYLTVGDPTVAETEDLARAALSAGADILELGVPFSDPTADGPVIAAASERAIRSGGSLRATLRVAAALRRDSDAPLVLFTYFNPVLTFGERETVEAAARAGVDALLIVDLPPEEGAALRTAAREADLAVIPLVTPTSDEARVAQLTADARGFIYYVSLTGVTGSAEAPLDAAARRAREISMSANVPVAVGFGVDSAEKARRLAVRGVAGVVVGTAIVRAIAEAPNERARVEAVRRLVAELRAGLDGR